MRARGGTPTRSSGSRSEEHTSELQSLTNLVCRLLLEKKNIKTEVEEFTVNTETISLSEYRASNVITSQVTVSLACVRMTVEHCWLTVLSAQTSSLNGS